MGTIQKHFRSMITMAMAITMMDGKQRKRYRGEDIHGKFGLRGFSGSPRMMLTLPPFKHPVERSDATKARKLAMRRAKRQRIDTRGFN